MRLLMMLMVEEQLHLMRNFKMYKLIKDIYGLEPNTVQRLVDLACIPFDPTNTDYTNFKKEINVDEAQLKDADGNVMTAEEAKAYIATLP